MQQSDFKNKRSACLAVQSFLSCAPTMASSLLNFNLAPGYDLGDSPGPVQHTEERVRTSKSAFLGSPGKGLPDR